MTKEIKKNILVFKLTILGPIILQWLSLSVHVPVTEPVPVTVLVSDNVTVSFYVLVSVTGPVSVPVSEWHRKKPKPRV